MTLKKVVPFELRLTINYVIIKPWIRSAFSGVKLHKVKGHLIFKIP